MKPVKRAEQKNVAVARDYYTAEQYADLEKIYGIADISLLTNEKEKNLRVFLHRVKDLKVVLDEYGNYANVAVMVTGERIFIEL